MSPRVGCLSPGRKQLGGRWHQLGPRWLVVAAVGVEAVVEVVSIMSVTLTRDPGDCRQLACWHSQMRRCWIAGESSNFKFEFLNFYWSRLEVVCSSGSLIVVWSVNSTHETKLSNVNGTIWPETERRQHMRSWFMCWGDQNRGAAQLRINLTNTSDNGDSGAASLYNSVTNDQRECSGDIELRSPLLLS